MFFRAISYMIQPAGGLTVPPILWASWSIFTVNMLCYVINKTLHAWFSELSGIVNDVGSLTLIMRRISWSLDDTQFSFKTKFRQCLSDRSCIPISSILVGSTSSRVRSPIFPFAPVHVHPYSRPIPVRAVPVRPGVYIYKVQVRVRHNGFVLWL
jgi:hypothetical protein